MHYNHSSSLVYENSIEESVVVLVDNPSVGKSMLFYKLTGKYAWVSNYPEATVEMSIGRLRLNDKEVKNRYAWYVLLIPCY